MSMLYALTSAMAVFGLMDWYSTRKILANGGKELNPIARSGMDILGVDGYLAFKAVLCTALTYFAGTVSIWLAAAVCRLRCRNGVQLEIPLKRRTKMEDPGWTHQLLGFGGAILGGLVGVIYSATHKRIDKVETVVDKKADHEYVKETAQNIGKIFHKLDEHIKDEGTQFQTIFKTINDNHVEILRELNKKADK